MLWELILWRAVSRAVNLFPVSVLHPVHPLQGGVDALVHILELVIYKVHPFGGIPHYTSFFSMRVPLSAVFVPPGTDIVLKDIGKPMYQSGFPVPYLPLVTIVIGE